MPRLPPSATGVSSLSARVAAKKAKKDGGLAALTTDVLLTDDEFRARVEQILRVLGNEASSWETKVEGAAVFTQLVLSPGSTERRCSLEVLGSCSVKKAMTALLHDLRSSVVREACHWVRSLSNACAFRADLWPGLCDHYFGVLLQCRSASVSAISQAAEETLLSIVERGIASRCVVQQLVQGCSSRNATLRSCALRYLFVLLCRADKRVVRRLLDAVQSSVRASMSDASEDCRRQARLCFWALEAAHPEAALALYESVSEALQVKLDDEKSNFNGLYQSHVDAITRLRDTAAVDIVKASFVEPQQVEDGDPKQAPDAPALGHQETPSRTSRREITQRRDASPTVSRNAAGDNRLLRFGAASSAVGYARRLEHSAPQTPQSAASRRLTQPGDMSPLEKAIRERDAAVLHEHWHQLVAALQSSDWSTRVTGLTLLTRFVEGTYKEGHELSKSQLSDVFRLLPFRMADPHFRVAAAAMECFDGVMVNVPQLVVEELPQLFTVLFQATISTKEPLRVAAQTELHAVSKVFDADVLLSPLYRVLDEARNTLKLRTAALEYMLYLIQQQPKLFTAALVKNTLSRLMHYAQREKTPVAVSHGTIQTPSQGISVGAASEPMKALAACIAALYQVNSDALVRSIVMLPLSEQLHVLNVARSSISHLEQDVRRMAAGERLLAHPDIQVPSPFEKALKEASPEGKLAQRKQALGTPQGSKRTPSRGPRSAADANKRGGADGATVTRSSRTLFEDVSVIQQPSDAAHHDRHYDPSPFSASTAKNADVLRRRETVVVGMSPSSPSKHERLRAQVAGRIETAVSEHRLPPEEVALLRRSRDSSAKRAATQLATASVSDKPHIWAEWFPELVSLVVAHFSDGDHFVRRDAIKCVETVVKSEHLHALVTKTLTTLLSHIVDRLDDPFPEVASDAAVVLHLICSGGFFPTEHVVLALLGYLQLHTVCNRSLLQAVEALGDVLWRAHLSFGGKTSCLEWLSQETLSAVAARLVALFSHEMSEVRKTVVSAIVQLWAVAGVLALPLLKPLTVSQRKLVTIYYQRHALDHPTLPGSDVMLDRQRDLGKDIEAHCAQ